MDYWAKKSISCSICRRILKKNHFFGRKVNKVPCIIGAIWGKINFLGIFGVKIHWIIGQKSQNSAQYAGAFRGNNIFFGKKVNKVPCNIVEIWGKIIFLGIIAIKIHWIIGIQSQNIARYAGAFGGKNHFIWKKSQ